MSNLFDSSTLINISDENTILKIAKYCKDILKSKLAITSIVLKELLSHAQKDNTPFEDFFALQNHLLLYIKSSDIINYDLEHNEEVYTNYRKLRKNYYGWMINKTYFEQLKADGQLSQDLDFYSIKNEYNKVDAGECSLIAVALTNPNEHVIVSDDAGDIHYLPSQNIFEIYKEKKDIKVYSFSEWKAINNYME